MPPLLLPPILLLSLYTTYTSLRSIHLVRRYEHRTAQAAKISNIAEEQLHNTRTTEAAGLLASALSVLSSLTFIIYPHTSNTDFNPGGDAGNAVVRQWQLAFAVFNTCATAVAADHISRFWRGKAKVPGVEGYSEAVTLMDSLVRWLFVLGCGWGLQVVLVVGALVGG